MIASYIKRVCVVFFTILFTCGYIHAQDADTISLDKVLYSLYNVGSLPAYISNSYSAQVSSYDITGGNDDGFSGKNSFIRRNADSSLVIFDVKGCGVINRIWTPTPTDDTLDFYFDGNTIPGLSVQYSSLFSGKQYPFISPLCGNDLGGFYCYFPIVFNKGCTIVCRGKKMQFHQIGYRLYPAGTVAKTFSSSLSVIEKKHLQDIAALWNNHNNTAADLEVDGPALKTISKKLVLQPDKTATIFNAAEGGRIAGIEISNANAFEGLEKLIDIQITWDNDKTPAIYCPLADFFGYAFGKPAMQSLLLGTKANTNYCYIPMPYDKKATVLLIYRSAADATPVNLTAKLFYSNVKRVPAKEGRLYAWWNNKTEDGTPHLLLYTKGRGHYIGTVLQAQGLRPGMTYFFEGDDSTVIDGTMHFHGTGSEDYFNGGWYALTDRWDGKLSLPLHGCLDYSLPFSRTGAYRFYLSDKMSFEKTIHHSIEHGPSGNHEQVVYTSLGFYYSDVAPDASSVTAPGNTTTKVYVPDTLIMYPQLMNATIENNIAVTTAWKYNTGGLSYTYTATNESGLKIAIDEIPLGKYKLLLDFVRNAEGAEFSIWMGQHNISGWINANATKEEVVQRFFVADFEHTPSRNSISIHFKTAVAKNKLVFNRLIFVAQK